MFRPHENSFPSAVTARANALPAWILATFRAVSLPGKRTSAMDVRSSSSPSPSCPNVLQPNAYSRPFSVSAREKPSSASDSSSPPAATATIFLAENVGTMSGRSRFFRCPSPSCPALLLPHVKRPRARASPCAASASFGSWSAPAGAAPAATATTAASASTCARVRGEVSAESGGDRWAGGRLSGGPR